MKIIILGASGMLGHCLFHYLSANPELDIKGTVRRLEPVKKFFPQGCNRIIEGVDAANPEGIRDLLAETRPNVLINCIGIIKQLRIAEEAIPSISINALLPHQLALMANEIAARLIHVSTDCVFDGVHGHYTESDRPNATDLYGKTKHLGELVNYKHAITIRTSIIGHELNKSLSLVDWFLSQKGGIKGFRRAIYSGFPTIELASIISDHILMRPSLYGLYHLSSDPINKYELLRLISDIYGHQIDIEPNDSLIIDRSMDSSRFRSETGYHPPSWRTLVERMHHEYLRYHKSNRDSQLAH